VADPSLRAQNRAVDSQETRTAPRAKDARLWNRCRQEPRIRGQRWCRPCRTSAQRDRRARLRVEGREQDKAVGVLYSGLAPEAVKQNRRDTPVVGKGMARQERPDELAASRSTAVLPPAAIKALARLRHAENEYEEARGRDWRRSVVSPGTVLPPLLHAVLRARMECRRLGVPGGHQRSR
jgi:hypothetical protein